MLRYIYPRMVSPCTSIQAWTLGHLCLPCTRYRRRFGTEESSRSVVVSSLVNLKGHSLSNGVSPSHPRYLAQSGSKEDEGGSVDYDSFLQPLLHDLKTLATDGVEAREYDPQAGCLTEQTFQLRAHVITVCGDMPAVAKVSNGLQCI